MCFYNEDFDWTVAVETEETRTAEKPLNCCECGGVIETGEAYHWRHQQEHDQCHACAEAECECENREDISHDCACERPDYGESWQGCTCLNCRKFLEAVKAHELEEGCREYESQPAPGNMIEQMQEFDAEQLAPYFSAAEKLHPDLAANGYLRRLQESFPQMETA